MFFGEGVGVMFEVEVIVFGGGHEVEFMRWLLWIQLLLGLLVLDWWWV